MIRMDLAPYSE